MQVKPVLLEYVLQKKIIYIYINVYIYIYTRYTHTNMHTHNIFYKIIYIKNVIKKVLYNNIFI